MDPVNHSKDHPTIDDSNVPNAHFHLGLGPEGKPDIHGANKETYANDDGESTIA